MKRVEGKVEDNNNTRPLEKSSRPKLTQDSAVWVSASGVCDEEHEIREYWIFLRERRRIELWGGMHGLVIFLQFNSVKHRNCCTATTAIAKFHIFFPLSAVLLLLTCYPNKPQSEPSVFANFRNGRRGS